MSEEYPRWAVADLRFRYRRDTPELFAGLTHQFQPAQITALIGPSGRGKSTLLYLLGLLLRPTEGEIQRGGEDVAAVSDAAASELRAADIGFVFQDSQLNPSATVRDSVAEPGLYRGAKLSDCYARAEELLAAFGLAEIADSTPSQISGGQAQRVAVARSLFASPGLILADEPTGNLDRGNANDAELAASLDSAGARLFTVNDLDNMEVINAATLSAVQSLSTVEVAVALSPASDTENALLQGGKKIAYWEISDPAAVLALPPDVNPQIGQAVISHRAQAKLSLAELFGVLENRSGVQFPIVGGGPIKPGFEDLADGALLPISNPEDYRELRVIITDLRAVPDTQREIMKILDPPDPSKLAVRAASGLTIANQIFSAQLQRYNQSLLTMIMGVGALFIAIVVLADVLLHRKDLGRRRALGITRTDLTLVTVWRTMVPAAIGALIGAVTAWITFATQGVTIDIPFALAIAILATFASALAALLPAVWASFRDPVAVLRTP